MKRKFYLKPARKNRIVLFFLLSISFLLTNFGCVKKNIEDDKAVRIYVENIIVEEKYSYNPDSLRIHQQFIFNKYKTTKQQFETYLKNLEADQIKWQSFFKKADEYLTELRKSELIN